MSVIPSVPQPKYLNLEYLFDQFFLLLKKLLALIIYLFKQLGNFRTASIVISVILIIIMGIILYRLILLRKKRKITAPIRLLAEEGEPKARSSKWGIVKEKINSQNPSDWKMAVIEADSILDDIFEKIGFKGEGLGEKLKSVEPSGFDNLQKIWDAHQVRKKITLAPTGFELTQGEAKAAVDNYEKALKELRYL